MHYWSKPMAYPYIPSGGLIQTAFIQFRKSLPSKVDSNTLKKLGIASSNEGSLINILKFIGVLNDENDKTSEGAKLFSQHKDDDFQSGLALLVKSAYDELFDLHGEDAWKLDRDALISFFRGADETSATTGGRQALTFQTLAALAGHREGTVTTRGSPGPRQPRVAKPKTAKKGDAAKHAPPSLELPQAGYGQNFGLTVRVEINLPANASASTYDNIFKSIRKNLLNDDN